MKRSVSHDVSELALRLLEGIGNPRALTVAILVRYGEWDTIASLGCDPRNYCTANDYAKSAAATSFLRKCEDLPTSFDRRKVALENWWKGERSCFLSNRRLEPYVNHILYRFDGEVVGDYSLLADRRVIKAGDFDGVDPRMVEFFRSVRKTILQWIGFAPNKVTLGRFGPGATFSDRGKLTTIPDKMSSHPSFTRLSRRHLPTWARTRWGSACAVQRRSPSVERGNRFSTAPKDATKFRAIASEPSINIFFQLGLGTELRKALGRIGGRLRPGIDLDSGQEVHRRVACEASRDGSMATLDLRNASDSVSVNLVRLLLPRRWVEALESLRSPFTQVDGRWVMLEKFSSMGNGYTFELETLIFTALAYEALTYADFLPRIGKDVYVYGDDIIVPRDGVKSVVAVLRYCGFELNPEKSFSDGDFRESCGGDYFAGVPVRPFFLKEQPYEPQHWIVIANGLRALSANLASPHGFAMVQRAWFYCLDQLPRDIRSCRGPQGLGDIVIHDEERFWQVRWRHPHHDFGKPDPLNAGYWLNLGSGVRTGEETGIRYLRCYRPHEHRKVSYGNFHPTVVSACATYGVGWGNGGVTPRDSVLSYKVSWVAWS
jgi:hypothetical protein